MPLNDRQCRFVAEYLVDLNATQAAIRSGYSAATANQIGARLLANVKVAAAIAEAQAARSRRTEVTADRVVLELARVAFGDPRRVMSWGPGGVKLRPSADSPRTPRRRMSGMAWAAWAGEPVGDVGR